jgi:hypothetical protein
VAVFEMVLKWPGQTDGAFGHWLERGGGRREKIMLAMKVYGGMGSGVNDA